MRISANKFNEAEVQHFYSQQHSVESIFNQTDLLSMCFVCVYLGMTNLYNHFFYNLNDNELIQHKMWNDRSWLILKFNRINIPMNWWIWFILVLSWITLIHFVCVCIFKYLDCRWYFKNFNSCSFLSVNGSNNTVIYRSAHITVHNIGLQWHAYTYRIQLIWFFCWFLGIFSWLSFVCDSGTH